MSGYIDTLEAGYRVGASEERWLEGIMASASPWLDAGLGVMAWTFDMSNESEPRIAQPVMVGGRPEYLEVPARTLDGEGQFVALAYCDLGPCMTSSEAMRRAQLNGGPDAEELLSQFPSEAGDFLAVLGSGPDRRGVLLGAPLSERQKIPPRRRSSLSQVASHLAAAYRLRQVIGSGSAPDDSPFAEAVLEPDGRCVHARGPAKSAAARERLKLAARSVDRARGRLRTRDGNAALDGWHALVAGRWSLVDSFERDGRRYLVAWQNAPKVPGLRGLTLRERQVLGHAALGHSNKLIAYELGLAPSTVSGLLRHGLRKLGLSTRAELMAVAGRWTRGAQGG